MQVPVVGIAEVLVKPIFTGSQREIADRIGPEAKRAGRRAGTALGEGISEGLTAETKNLEADVLKLTKVAEAAQERLRSSKEKLTAATRDEAAALGAARIAAAKLAEIRAKSSAQASTVMQAEERLSAAMTKASAASIARANAQQRVSDSNDAVGRSSREASAANEKLTTHINQVADASTNAERSTNRLGRAFANAFSGNPLQRVASSVRNSTRDMSLDFHKMANSVSQSGTRGGRIFTRMFLLVGASMAALPPLVGAAGAALVAGSGAVVTFASSLKDLLGVSALAPAALLAIAAAGGVLRAAFSGIGTALAESTKKTSVLSQSVALDTMAMQDAARGVADAEERAAEVRVDSARRVESAQASLLAAQQDAARAQRGIGEAQARAASRVADAVRSVADAEQDVVRANRRVLDSQRALTEARQEAIETIRDLQLSLEGSALSERDAAIRLEEARIALAEGQKAGLASGSLEMRKLVLDVDQATFSLKTAKEETAALAQENADAARAGIEGSKVVLTAEKAVQDAREDAADAARALGDAGEDLRRAEMDGAADIADAQQEVAEANQRVAEAQQGVAEASADGAKAQRDALRSVEDASRSLERQRLQQAEATAKADQKANDAMANLTPNAQRAVTSLLGVYAVLGDIRNIAQENFFAGFTGPLERLAEVLLPELATGVAAIATELGKGAQQLMTSLTDAFDQGVLTSLLLTVAESLGILNGAIDPIIQAFVTLGVVGMEFLPGFATWVRDIAEQFNAFIQQAATDGSLKKWIEDGITAWGSLFSIMGSVNGIFEALATAARTGGIDVTLGGVASALERMETTMQGETFQATMATIFSGAAAGAAGLLAAMDPIGQAFVNGAPALENFLRLGGEILGMFIGGIFTAFSDPTFGKGLTDFMNGLKAGMEKIVPLLPGLMDALGRVLSDLAPIFEKLGPTMIEVFTFLADGLEKVLNWLSPLLTAMADSPAIVGLFIAAFGATAAISALLTFAGNLKTILGLGGALSWLFGKLPAILGLVRGAFALLSAVFLANPIGIVIALVAALVAGLIYFFTETEVGRKAWKAFTDWFAETNRKMTKWFEDEFLKPMGKVLDDLVRWFNDTNRSLTRKWNDFTKGIGMGVDAVIGFFGDMGDALGDLPGTFRKIVKWIGEEWDKLREKAKKPIVWVIDGINNGLIKNLNDIPGVKITPLRKPKGWRTGGYTGNIPEWEEAGAVHGKEFVLNAAATRRIGVDNLYAMQRAATSGSACARAADGMAARQKGGGNMGGFFEGNAAAIRQYGAYYLDVPPSLGPWNFKGAANLWDGAAGVKVKIGRGQKQGYAIPRERGGGILGYTTGNNIDMSPSWMARLGAKQRLTIAAHEMGHALGLPHNSSNSIMQPNLANMAAVPTGIDIGNLQTLFPGGSGKAGTAAPSNPLNGLIDLLVAGIKKAFPGGGMFVDAAGGLAKLGLGQVTKWVDDIRKGIVNIANDVVNGIKDFFGGGGAMGDGGDILYRDEGGPIPPGVNRILNNTGQTEYGFTPREISNMHDFVANRANGAAQVNVTVPERAGDDPSTFGRRVGEAVGWELGKDLP